MHSESSREVVVNVIKLKDLIVENRLNEADHRKEAWDVLQHVKRNLRTSYSTVQNIRGRFPLKGSQVALSNSAASAIGKAEDGVSKLMKDIARG